MEVLEWNERGIKFYESLGAKVMGGWVGMRLGQESMTRLSESPY